MIFAMKGWLLRNWNEVNQRIKGGENRPVRKYQ